MSRSTRHCVVPLLVRLRGVPSDDRLAETSDAIARAIAGRLLEANRVIAAREGWPEWKKIYSMPETGFSGASLGDDLQRRVIAAIETGIARAISGRAPAQTPPQFVLARYPTTATAPARSVKPKASRRRHRPGRGWRVVVARDFYTSVEQYAEFFESMASRKGPSIELGSLYAGMSDKQRRVSLWLVQVDRAYRIADLEQELSARVTELSRLKHDQELFWVRGVAEAHRQKLIQIDPSGVAEHAIPDLSGNSSYLSVVRGEPYLLAGGRLFLTAMVLPKIRLADYLRVDPEIQLSLRYRDLEFLISLAPAGFESRFHVSWADFLASYGDRETTLHIYTMEVLRRAEWQTINALVEEATRVGAQEEDARNWWRLEPLNRTFLDSFPDKAKQLIAGRTDSATLALSDSDKWAPWQPGWRAAIAWANFQVTADQRFATLNREAVGRLADLLIGHLGAFKDDLDWWLKIGHIFEDNFSIYGAAESVRTVFDLVMEELEKREGGRWFNFLLDTLDTNDGNATRFFLEAAFASANYGNHPRIVALRGHANAAWRDALRNSYFPDTNAIWLQKDGAKRVGMGGVVADTVADYSRDEKGQQLVESRRAEFETAFDAEGKTLVEEIAKGKTGREFSVDEFNNEVLARAARSIKLTNDDFEKVKITYSARVKKVELITDRGLQHYEVTWNLVKSIDGARPWVDVPDTERTTIDYLFDDMLFWWGFGRTGERFETAGLIIAGIGVVAVAWEVGVIAALVDLGGGATVVLSSIVLSEIITLIHKGRKFSLEDFVWAAIEGYINAVTFRLAGLGGGAIAARIGTSSLTRLVGGAILNRMFTGIVGGATGAALTVFAHGIAGVLLGNSTFPTLGDFVSAMALGAVMGLAGEFIIGPALQAAFRIGGQTALSTIGEAVRLVRESGTSPAKYAALIGEALGSLRQRLVQFLEEKSVAAILTGLRERLAELGEALGKVPGAAKQRFELALYRRIFEVSEIGLSRLETDGLERLLTTTEAGAAQMGRDELLFFLNGLARDPAQARRVLQGLGRLADEQASAVIASGQLDAFVGANNLLRHLAAHDADMVWELWNGKLFDFKIGDFEAWLGRISNHADDQQVFALQLLRRPDQLITAEGIAQALDKGGLTNDVVAGLDRLYGAVDDPALADAIMTGAARDNAKPYLLFLRSLSQEKVNSLADQGILQPLSVAPQVVAHASSGDLDILTTLAAIRGPGPGSVEAALALLNRLSTTQLRDFLAALNTLEAPLVGDLARAGQMEALAAAPQLAGVIRSDPVLRHLVATTASLPTAEAATRVQTLLGVARSLPAVPESLSRGAEFARGGTSIVYEVAGHPELLVKTGGGRLPVEAQSLIELEAIGIDTVYAGTRSIEGQTHIALRRIDGVSSKDIIGRVRKPLRTPQQAEIVTQRTVDDLERIYQRLSDEKLNIGDFQFIVRRSDGAVFVNDPVSTVRGRGPSGNIRNIIDRFKKILRDSQSGSEE
jgi:hypothetical protein